MKHETLSLDILEAIENYIPGTTVAERVIWCLQNELSEDEIEDYFGFEPSIEGQVANVQGMFSRVKDLVNGDWFDDSDFVAYLKELGYSIEKKGSENETDNGI